jgi:DNA polymerase III subunit gamma/tau
LSYQVIARRWRSKSFQELVGQEAISQTLRNALKSSRLPHALLLTGPRGTGKTSTARILAKTVRCPNVKDFAPCNVCDECVDIDQSRSVDVIEIDGASNNGVDAVRELRDTVAFQPAHGRTKFYIIDEVHMLTTSAFNALLKTLEEPPPHVVFVMATTEAQKVPNTILSRCQRLDFRRISTRQIASHLEHICLADKIAADNEALWTIARQGDGSMRDAQSLLDQVITFCDGKLSREAVTEALGLTDRSLLNDILKAIVSRSAKKTLQLVEKLLAGGQDPKIFLNDLLEQIRHLLVVKLHPEASGQLVDLPDSEVQVLKELASQVSDEDVHLLFDLTLKAAQDVGRHHDARLVLEVVMLRMASAPRIVNLLTLSTQSVATAQVAAKTQSEQPAPAVKVSAPLPSETPVVKANAQPVDRWSDFVARVKKVNAVIGAQLENTYLKDMTHDTVVLGIPAKLKFLQAKLSDKEFQKKITTYLNTFWGQNLQLKVEVEGDSSTNVALTPKATEEKDKRTRDESVRQAVENHPLVKNAQNVFKSQIRSINPSGDKKGVEDERI